jgi:acyl-CoA hydrolase
MEQKTVKNSHAEMTEIIFPNDANPLGNIFGGRVMQLIDIVGSLSAMRHARHACITASMDRLDFLSPAYVGEVLVLFASVNYVARTSMEVGVKVFAENPLTGERRHTASAYLTYVSIDQNGKPVEVPRIVPETDPEKRRYAEAQVRREYRLKEREKRREKSD